MRRNLNSEFQIQIQIVKDTFVQKKPLYLVKRNENCLYDFFNISLLKFNILLDKLHT